MLNDSIDEVRILIDAKGFSSDEERWWECFALIHSEVSEATDAYKKGRSLEEVGEELIDTVIRVFHLISAMGLDGDELFEKKMEKNWSRPRLYNTERGG